MPALRFPHGYRACKHCDGTGREVDPVSFGKFMRAKRKSAGVSLRSLAEHIKRSPPYISDVERGNRSFHPELIANYEAAIVVLKKKKSDELQNHDH